MESLSLDDQEYKNYCSIENSVGTIVDDNLLIYQDGMILCFKVGHLIKVSFHKTRNYFLNFVSFVLAIICIWVILYKETSFLEYLILLVFSVFVAIMGCKIKSIYYTVVILRANLAFTEIKFKGNQLKDVEELLVNIKEKLKERSNNL